MPHSTSAPSCIPKAPANHGRTSFSRNHPPSFLGARTRDGLASAQSELAVPGGSSGLGHPARGAASSRLSAIATASSKRPGIRPGSLMLAILNVNHRIDLMAIKPRWHGITSATGLRPNVSLPPRAALRTATRGNIAAGNAAPRWRCPQGFGPRCLAPSSRSNRRDRLVATQRWCPQTDPRRRPGRSCRITDEHQNFS
jgi:hypothetical protein